MSVIRMLLEEIRYRKVNFLLSLLGVVIAAALFIAAPTLIDGYNRQTDAVLEQHQQETDEVLARLEDETRKAMLGLGFNLKIMHRDTDMANFWNSGYAEHDMPQKYVQRLASARQLTLVTHLVATLQARFKWEDRNVHLVGYLPETTQSHSPKKKPMGYQIEPGTAYLGYELGRDHEVGEEITVGDTKLTIAKILPEHGDIEDILLATSLKDAQEILDKPDRVNLILAIGCRCAGERLPKVRKQLETVLPETKIFEHRTQALARAEQRNLVAQDREEIVTKVETQRSNSQQRMERYAAVTTPLMILISAFWVGTSTLINVRERRSEIGLLRALGKGSARIAMLFLGKAILIGILGGLAGFALGTATAQWMGQSLMDIPGDMIAPIYWLLPWALLGTPLLCAMAAYLPTLIAVVQNPAVVLRDA